MVGLQCVLCVVLTRPGQATGKAEANGWHYAECWAPDSGLGESSCHLWLWNLCVLIWEDEDGHILCLRHWSL